MQKEEVSAGFPAFVEDLAGFVGWSTALRVVRAFGGCNLRVPIRPDGSSAGKEAFEVIAEGIGHEGAAVLVKEYGGERLYVPRCAAAQIGRAHV